MYVRVYKCIRVKVLRANTNYGMYSLETTRRCFVYDTFYSQSTASLHETGIISSNDLGVRFRSSTIYTGAHAPGFAPR